MYARIVEWVQEAYSEILKMHPWSFLWARATPSLTIGLTDYAGSDFSPVISNLGEIFARSMFDTTSTGTPRVHYRDWTILDQQATAVGPPRYFCRRPDGKISFYPTPDDTYALKFDYQRDGHTFASGSDTPLIPDASLHKIIVYKALQFYGMHDENSSAVQHGMVQFNILLARMMDKYGKPLMTAPAPLGFETNPSAMELV